MQFDRLCENWIKPVGQYTLEDMLYVKGWKYLSSGAYGSVYSNPKKNYILKVYTDKGYRAFLDFLESQQGNPNVVMIKRHLFKSESLADLNSSHVEVVAIEKLNPLPYGSFWEKFISAVWSSLQSVKNLKRTDRPIIIETIRKSFRDILEYHKLHEDKFEYHKQYVKDYTRLIDAFEVALKRYRNLIDTIFSLKTYVLEHNLPVRFDLHSGNFMVRPSTGQIVITDPLAND